MPRALWWSLGGGAVSYERGTPVVPNNRSGEQHVVNRRFDWVSLVIDSCITQLKAQGPSRSCNESKEGSLVELSSRKPTSAMCGPGCFHGGCECVCVCERERHSER